MRPSRVTTADSANSASSLGHRHRRVDRARAARASRASRRTGLSLEPGLARYADDAGQRVGPLLVGGLQHARRAEARRSTIATVAPRPAHTRCMSWNKSSDLRAERELLLDARRARARRRSCEPSRRGAARHRAGHRRAARRPDPRARAASSAAARRIRRGGSARATCVVDRQLAVVKRLEVARARASHGMTCIMAAPPAARARSVCRARVRRDFTVPTATPSEKAISS